MSYPTPGRDEFIVPTWQRLSSGLIVPGSVARTGLRQLMPSHVAPTIFVPARASSPGASAGPHSSDQVLARPAERELGLTPSDLTFLQAQASEIPFEPAMLAIARLATALWDISTDGAAQVALAEGFFDRAAIADVLGRWVGEEEGRVAFSEQQFFVVQRLLIDHARDGAIADGMTEAEFVRLKRLIFGAATLVDEGVRALEESFEVGDELLTYLVQNGAYHARPNMLNALARAFAIFAEGARGHEDGLPLDLWIEEDYSLSLEEQFAAGFALHAAAHVFSPELAPSERALVEPEVFATSAFRNRGSDVRQLLAASREWYRAAFEPEGDVSDLAWETVPFMQRPFLELSSGQLVLLSPRAINLWLGDGFYYRVLNSAQRRNTEEFSVSLAFTRFVGDLIEEWAVRLVNSAHPGERPAGAGRVHGEQLYDENKLSPDVAIDLGTDLVLIEVRSGYLTRELRVGGDVQAFHRDLDRLVLRKARQLCNRIDDLFQGRWSVPEVETAHLARVWPLLVTADITQTEPLLELIERSLPPIYADARVQRLLVLDLEDLELLMGLVEHGVSLVQVLEQRQRGPYAELELKRWILEDPESRGEHRPSFALEGWERVQRAVAEALDLEDG